MPDPPPQLRIIAGPNGSGKTTFVTRFLPRYAEVRNFVNADLIAAGLSPFAPEQAAIRAGRIMLAEIERLAVDHVDFAFETTLSGRTYEPLVRRLRQEGYNVLLYFLWLPTLDLNLGRIAQRVRLGGHNIPEETVRRRHGRGIANFLNVYRSLVDSWMIFDNSGSWPREVAFALGGTTTILDPETFRRFQQAGGSP